MLKPDGIGAGYGLTDGTGGSSYGDGFGFGIGDSSGDGESGNFRGRGCGIALVSGCGNGYNLNSICITTTVIDTDPLTVAYQAATMQILGEHHG